MCTRITTHQKINVKVMYMFLLVIIMEMTLRGTFMAFRPLLFTNQLIGFRSHTEDNDWEAFKIRLDFF